jgi:hypothetical protein
MTQLEITLWATFIGAAVGSVFSSAGILLNSWITQNRERRQQIWQTEINRLFELEERAGQLVELVSSYRNLDEIRMCAIEGLQRLANDAGRFRRHRGLMQSIRDLHNGLSRLLADRRDHRDDRETRAEVYEFFDVLLNECDKVTGRRTV